MSKGLQSKTFTELRGIAQSFGVADIFQKDHNQLVQAIEAKQVEMKPVERIEIPKPEYDARLMTKPPAKTSPQGDAEKLLEPYIAKGLHVKFDEECWHMTYGKVTDSGSVRMPLRVILRCADRVMSA